MGLGKGQESILRLGAMLENLKVYFGRLAYSGCNIVYSVPVRAQRGQNLSYAYTDVKYQIVTKSPITLQTYVGRNAVYDAPVILILGMCNFRSMPASVVWWHDFWVIPNLKYKTIGTVYLSKNAFLESRLLPLLEKINEKTTVVPQFAGIVNDEWHFDIATWEKDAHRNRQRCAWGKADSTSKDVIEYVWNHYGEMSQREKGTVGTETNAETTLSCKFLVPSYVQSADTSQVARSTD